MRLNYIFGGAGTGKTRLCLSQILSAINDGSKDTPIIYIVPEQFSLQAEKSIVLMCGQRATIRAQVLSFERLAYHIYAKSGGAGGKVLEDSGKNMLLRKIVLELRDELLFFCKAADKEGFLDNLSQAVTELYRYDITTEALEQLLQKVGQDSLYIKLCDILKIYTKYKQYTVEKYITADSLLQLLPDKIDSSEFLNNADVWFDGFNGFTPQEYKIIEHTLKKAGTVTFSMTVNSGRTNYDGLKQTDPFFETKNTVNKLTAIAGKIQAQINKPVFLQENYRHVIKPGLKFFVENYFSYSSEKYAEIDCGISVFRCSNKYSEVSVAAKKIIELLREFGYRFCDIAVVSATVDDYEGVIDSVFNEYGIPYFSDQKTDILSHPLAELVRSAVDIIAFNWQYEAVFRFLKTGLVGFSREEADLLENYAVAYGIKGYKWNLPSWEHGFGEGGFLKEQILDLKNRLINSLLPLLNLSGKKNSVVEYCRSIYNMLINLDVINTLEGWQNNNDTFDSTLLTVQHGQIWNKVCQLFEKMVEILGDEQISKKEFVKVLEAGFKAVDMGVIPPSADQVIVGDIERTRLPNIKALFVLGANDGVLPRVKDDSGLFTDDERNNLLSFGLELAPDSSRKTAEDQFLIYSAVAKASQELFFTYSTGNLDGKALRPSNVISKIKNMFPYIIEVQDEALDFITLPKPMFNEFGAALRDIIKNNESTGFSKAFYEWCKKDACYSGRLNKMEQIINESGREVRLRAENIQRLYGKEIYTTTTRLEKYALCPFAYFMQYNLKATERKTYDVKPVDFGNLFHNILEEFTKTISERGLSFRDLSADITSEIVDELINRLAPEISNEVMHSTPQYKYALKRISRISKRSIWALAEHIKRGEFEPSAVEAEFSDASLLKTISVSINDRNVMKITGRIDRIDVTDINGNTYVKIIDYKSGNTKFDLTDIYYGVQLQLLLYLDAIIQNGRSLFGGGNIKAGILPGGVFYFNIDDPIIEWNDEFPKDQLDRLILKCFKMSGLVLADKEVISKMDCDLSRSSDIMPVGLSAANEFTKHSSVATDEEFTKIRNFVLAKIKEIGENILDGRIEPMPYKKGNKTPCLYCGFGAVCGFSNYGEGKYNIAWKKTGIDQFLN